MTDQNALVKQIAVKNKVSFRTIVSPWFEKVKGSPWRGYFFIVFGSRLLVQKIALIENPALATYNIRL
ncbi:MAG: hypothetical protein EXR98_20230 [Gemmataceae bacterium]|nr:hypothetical protein [Gemmataceae bacterium]